MDLVWSLLKSKKHLNINYQHFYGNKLNHLIRPFHRHHPKYPRHNIQPRTKLHAFFQNNFIDFSRTILWQICFYFNL